MTIKYDWSDLKELYQNKLMSTKDIGRLKGCSSALVSHQMKVQAICPRTQSESIRLAIKQGKPIIHYGENNGNWKGGRRTRLHGYMQVKDRTHPKADKDGYIWEHTYVWEKVYNCRLPDGWRVHHLNGITNDNRPSNLKALPDYKHRKGHETINLARKQRIRELEEENRLLRKALDDGQMIFVFSTEKEYK